NIRAGSGGGAELAVGMSEQLALGRHEAAAQNLVAVLHLLGRLVIGLLAEEIGDAGRIVVQVYALGPTAVDIIKHTLERPQAGEETEAVVISELSRARLVDYGIHRRDGGVDFALFD